MKTILTHIFLLAGAYAGIAQCTTGCSSTVNGTSTLNYYIPAGQKLCIAPNGTVTGIISVSGGTLCNQGTITTSKVLVASGGRYENYGSASIDSLLVTGNNSTFVNNGTTTHVRMATANLAVSTNNNSMQANYIGDSLGTFYNNGSIVIHQSMYNAYNSVFQNSGPLTISQDFYNSTGATFSSKCMVTVSHDWYNSATITGQGTTCGGFKITNGSYNSGTVTTSAGPVDLCDLGNTTGIDANSGTISSGVTYCQCTNTCTATPMGVNELSRAEQMSLYPNPAGNMVHLRYSKMPDTIELYDAMGQQVLLLPRNQHFQAGEASLSLEGLPPGIYLLVARSAGGAVFSSKLIKESN